MQPVAAPSRFRFRSLLSRSLALVACSTLLSIALLTVIYLHESRRSGQFLEAKAREIASRQNDLLAGPLAAADHRQIQLLLDAQLDDPDVVGVAVYDPSGATVRRAGVDVRADRTVYTRSQPLRDAQGETGRNFGKIEVTLTDRRLRQELKARYVFAGWAVVAAGVVLALLLALVFRRTLHTPLMRLLESMRAAGERGVRMPVSWPANDEMGRVVSAFNRMQSAQEGHEQRLRRARDEEGRILEVVSSISSELELDVLLRKVISIVTDLLGAEAASLFLYDPATDELWSRVWEGTITQEIRIPAASGLAGACFASGEVLNIPDPYSDPRFNREVDRRTGYRTRNILCLPVRNRTGENLGVLQIVNKIEGGFDDWDVDRLQAFSAQFAIALENAQLYEDLKALDKAKEKVINHLSHELKTPLVILSGVLDLVRKELAATGNRALERTLLRGRRNIQRLMDLQHKIDDILQQRSVEDEEQVLKFIESAIDVLGDLGANTDSRHAEILTVVSERLERLFGMAPVEEELVGVSDLLREVCDRASAALAGRELDISRDIEEGLQVMLNSDVLTKACEGIVRNAVENTPDHGTIEVTARSDGDDVTIEVRDYGVGITTENQKLIFGGFFHTQSTDAYSSRRPYQFDAGGSGTDLLRIKCLSERHGFAVCFDSTRCGHIPGDHDVCPGNVRACGFIDNPEDCRCSGGSVFSITIPAALKGQGAAG